MKGKWKHNNSKKKKGNAVLQKYMVSVDEFVKSKSGADEVSHDQGLRFVKKKSRKETRKEKRKMKKAKMKSHYEGNKTLSLPKGDGENSGMPGKKQPREQTKKTEKAQKKVSKSKFAGDTLVQNVKSKMPSSAKKGKKMNKLQESRKLALLEANEQEDREIKKLERCLGLNKRKNKKSLPQSFMADGLDYILGVLDSGSSAAGLYDDDDDMDMAKDNFEKLENESELSEEEKSRDELSSEGSDEDMASFDDENEDENDDEMVEEGEMQEGEEEEEEIEEDEDEMDDSDENEEEIDEEAETLHAKTSESNSKTVSSQT